MRCVVSVSMLTEGWDANTVTHILGVRAFGTQLLCEQVVGRGLRRISYEPNDGRACSSPSTPRSTACRSASSRPAAIDGAEPPAGRSTASARCRSGPTCEITFPRVAGYRYDLPTERLEPRTSARASVMTLSTDEVPTWTELDPIVGEKAVHNLDDLRGRRDQEVAFRLARRILDDNFRDADGYDQAWLFPQLVPIAERWLADCVVCKDGTFPQLLLLAQWQHAAAERIYRAIVRRDRRARSA